MHAHFCFLSVDPRMFLRPLIARLASTGMRRSCVMGPVALAAELSVAPRAPRLALAAVWQQQDSYKHHNHQQRCCAAAAAAAYRGNDRYAALRSRPASGAPPPPLPPPEAEHAASPSSSSRGSGALQRRLSSPLESRRWLASQLPYKNYKAVGVSFEDRQPAIAALHQRACCRRRSCTTPTALAPAHHPAHR